MKIKDIRRLLKKRGLCRLLSMSLAATLLAGTFDVYNVRAGDGDDAVYDTSYDDDSYSLTDEERDEIIKESDEQEEEVLAGKSLEEVVGEDVYEELEKNTDTTYYTPDGSKQEIFEEAAIKEAEKREKEEEEEDIPPFKPVFKFALFAAAPANTKAKDAYEKVQYKSKLPVLYINTDDGEKITSKTEYKDGSMYIQGNSEYKDASMLYDGKIQIRGRGNSTWNLSYRKLPYKVKLETKTNLFGMGKNKHWVLLANYMDESLMRNKTSYDLAAQMGLDELKNIHVDVVLNGAYAGNYLFVEAIRTGKERVDIFSWESAAEDAASAICKAEGIKGDAKSAFQDQMNENMRWITTDSVTYNGKTYKVSDYYKDLPKNKDGTVNVNGGYLFELDDRCQEVSLFKTNLGVNMLFKEPEFAQTNTALFNSAKNYVQAVEDSCYSNDFYTTYNNESVHYTDLLDMDALVRYYMIYELYMNSDGLRLSCYLYKDIDKKLVYGPVWDMDYTSNSQVSASKTNQYTKWAIQCMNTNSQAKSIYKKLYNDPYFLTKLYEVYHEYRSNFDEIVKTGGTIDKLKTYLNEAAKANYDGNFNRVKSPFDTEVERFRTFLNNRLTWLDKQFQSIETLRASFGGYKLDSSIQVGQEQKLPGKITYTATTSNGNVKKVGFYQNGILLGKADVKDGKASVSSVTDKLSTREKEPLNTIQVRGFDASGNLLADGMGSNYLTFTKRSDFKVSIESIKDKKIKLGATSDIKPVISVDGNKLSDADRACVGDVEYSMEKLASSKKLGDSYNVIELSQNGGMKALASGIVKVTALLKDYGASTSFLITVPGDTNGDGKISARDAYMLSKFIRFPDKLKMSEYMSDLADINCDGKINTTDMTDMLKTIG